MAAIMLLWNRFSSYFAKREEYDNMHEDLAHRSEVCLGCHSDVQQVIDRKQLCQSCYAEIPPKICTVCDNEIPATKYKDEH